MGKQLVKQADGKWAVWSSVVDDIVMYDATLDEIIGELIGLEATRIMESVRRKAEQIEKGENPYHQFKIEPSVVEGAVERARCEAR